MQQERRDAEALRRRLYRPDASEADLVAYRSVAVHHERPAEPERASPARPARSAPTPRTLLTLAGSVVLLAASAVAVGSLAAPAASPAARATAAPSGSDDVVVPQSVVDRGARDHAAGDAAAAPDAAEGVDYTVAGGDTVTAIAGRFGLCVADVLVAMPYGFDPARPPAGQHLLLQRVLSTGQRYNGTGDC